ELWGRLERRHGPRGRPWRLQRWPALGALAAVVLIGLAVFAVVPRLSASQGAGGTHQGETSSSGSQPPAQLVPGGRAGRPQQADTAGAGFGRVRAPMLGAPASGSAPAVGGLQPYYGPARLTVTAPPPAVPTALPVYRFRQPAAGDLDSFASQLGASRFGVAGTPTLYRSSEFQLRLATASSGAEPSLLLSALSGPSEAGSSDSRQVADAFLAAHPQLRPSAATEVQLEEGGQGQVVLYQREFEIPGGQAAEVDSSGRPAGLRLEVGGGAVIGGSGPIPFPLDSTEYRPRAPEQAARDAAAGSSTGGATPAPAFELNQVQLAYMVVNEQDYGYFVPVYLYTGSAKSGQVTLVKRVAVPALDPSQLR
ncbi:MAG TPA: hypothetical protein VGE42_09440, partial [Candidatus Dormibacteraeota bacterium]